MLTQLSSESLFVSTHLNSPNTRIMIEEGRNLSNFLDIFNVPDINTVIIIHTRQLQKTNTIIINFISQSVWWKIDHKGSLAAKKVDYIIFPRCLKRLNLVCCNQNLTFFKLKKLPLCLDDQV